MHLSANFTLEELCRSETALRHGIDNTPNAEQIEALRLLCEHVLQPLRNQFGPIRITSGFRSVTVNSWVGGSSKSDHCRGNAADIEVPGASLIEVAEWVRGNLTYKQCILEFPPDGWVHVSYDPSNNKCELLTATKQDGKTVYSPGLIV